MDEPFIKINPNSLDKSEYYLHWCTCHFEQNSLVVLLWRRQSENVPAWDWKQQDRSIISIESFKILVSKYTPTKADNISHTILYSMYIIQQYGYYLKIRIRCIYCVFYLGFWNISSFNQKIQGKKTQWICLLRMVFTNLITLTCINAYTHTQHKIM